MNEDYLWDKSGDPDPQIQQLEEIMLRYQPRPLKLPTELTPPRRRSISASSYRGNAGSCNARRGVVAGDS